MTIMWVAGGMLLVFWALGAYNRLVRLRADAIKAFVRYEDRASRAVEFVREHWTQADGGEPRNAQDDAQCALLAAAEQFDVALRRTAVQPLAALHASALGTAYGVFEQCWHAISDAPPDLAGPSLPQALEQEWALRARALKMARLEFNQEVRRYNEALALFPTRLLAGLFGMQPAPYL